MGYLLSDRRKRSLSGLILFRIIIAPLFVLGSIQGALAHIGHVGEIGGHGHLVGVTLGAGAMIVAGWLAKSSSKSTERDIEQDGNAPEEEPSDGAVTARLGHMELVIRIPIMRNGDRING